MLRSSPSLAEVKKKGRMKKLSQTAEQDLIMGLQGLVRGSWDNQNPKVLHPGQCGMFPLIQEARTLSGTGLVFDEQLNEFHCLWDDR